jgi:hypothetical protein
VEIGAERYNQLDAYAKKLIGNDSPYAVEIEKHQEQLG